MYYYYVLLDGRGAGWRVVGNALRAVHVRVNFFLRHRFPWKFPETVFFRASQISERISGNLDQSQGVEPRRRQARLIRIGMLVLAASAHAMLHEWNGSMIRACAPERWGSFYLVRGLCPAGYKYSTQLLYRVKIHF